MSDLLSFVFFVGVSLPLWRIAVTADRIARGVDDLREQIHSASRDRDALMQEVIGELALIRASMPETGDDDPELYTRG